MLNWLLFHHKSLVGRYISAIGASLFLVWVKVQISDYTGRAPYILLILVIALSALTGGVGPAIVATIITAASAKFIYNSSDLLISLYLVEAMLLIWVIDWQNRLRTETDRSREWYSTTLISLGDAVVSLDEQNRIVFVNDVAERMLGIKSEAVGGASVSDVLTIMTEKRQKNILPEILKKTHTGKKVSLMEGVIIKTSVHQLFVVGSAAPVVNSRGFQGTTFIFRDISPKQYDVEQVATIAKAIRSSHDAVYTTDMNGIITSWNQGAERMFGYRWREAVGKDIQNLTVPDSELHQFLKIRQHIAKHDYIEPYEAVRKNKKGDLLYVITSVSYVRNELGKVIGVGVIAKDISVQKRTEDELRKRNTEFEALVENSPDLISRHSPDGKYLYANVAVASANGRDPQEFIGKTMEEAGIDLATARLFSKTIHTTVRTRKQQAATYSCENTFGEQTYHSRFVPELTIRGNVASVLIISRDITELKKSEDRKDEFIAIAGHELKTPLTSLKVYIELMQKKWGGNGELGSYIHKISEQTTILNRLVHSLLDVSRIDRGNLALEMEQFSMNELIQETIESLQPTTHIPIYFQAHKKASVSADKNRIRQVLINLLSNAIKYSPSEGSVEIRLYKEIDRCIVSVKDSGIGIEKKHLALVFKRFFRVYGHDTRRFAGMGMGLYISHEIIKGHKGKIWVESEKGKGSTFFFSLPTSY